MKKIFLIVLIFVFVMSVGAVVYAAEENFVPSISSKPAPELVGVTDVNTGEAIELVITPMMQIETLPEKVKQVFEGAKEVISKAKNITTVNSDLKPIAKGMGVKGEQLIVSDLFDISEKDFKKNEGCHYNISMEVNAVTIGRFVALLHYTNSKWECVENVKIAEDGKTLEFEVDNLSPFAIVVVADETPAASLDWISVLIWSVFSVLVVAGIAVLTIFFFKKKMKNVA